MNILVFHSKSHVGGGNTYIRNLIAQLKSEHTIFYVENNPKLFELKTKVKKNLVDAVILNIYFPRHILIALYLRLLNKPIINITHGLWYLEGKSMNSKQTTYTTLKFWLAQYVLFLLSNKIVLVSNYEYRLFQKGFPYFLKNKPVIISGGVHIPSVGILTQKKKEQTKKNLHYTSKRILLLVSRLERRKGIEHAIKAFEKNLNYFPETILIIIFSSDEFNQYDYFSELLQLVSSLNIGSKVFFHTGIAGKELNSYYRIADLFLLPSLDLETFGLTLLEAFSCGCPTVAFNTGNPPDIINSLHRNLIAKETNHSSFEKCIRWFFSLDRSRRYNLSMRAYAIAHQYTWEKTGNSFQTLLNSLIAKR